MQVLLNLACFMYYFSLDSSNLLPKHKEKKQLSTFAIFLEADYKKTKFN